jgi:hypothetical protein
VAIGLGLLVLAGAVVVAVFEASEPGPGQTTHLLTLTLPNGENASALVWGLNGSRVAFALSWHSDAGVGAVLSTAPGCSGNPTQCAPGELLVKWVPGSTAGAWSTSTSSGFPWLLQVRNAGPSTVHFFVTTTAVRAPVPATTGWAYDVFLVAGAALGGIGAVAMFLGLFLRGGVYRSRGDARNPPPAGPPAH